MTFKIIQGHHLRVIYYNNYYFLLILQNDVKSSKLVHTEHETRKIDQTDVPK